jgi:hypothetical protein
MKWANERKLSCISSDPILNSLDVLCSASEIHHHVDV